MNRSIFAAIVGIALLSSVMASTAYPTETFTVFGPQEFSRTKGAPTTVTESFSVPNPGDFFDLHVDNSGVSSAVIALNGVDILGPAAFNRQIRQIQTPVELLQDNVLTVQLRGKPGSMITVEIVGPPPKQMLITEVITANAGESIGPGFVPLTFHKATRAGETTVPSDVNKGIGGDTVNIWAKYEEVILTSNTLVITDVTVEHWPYWEVWCPSGFEPAGGSKGGKLTTGTWGDCYRMGLCVRKQPVNRQGAIPLMNLGLSYTSRILPEAGLEPAGLHYSCPPEVVGDEVNPLDSLRTSGSRDIHDGCGDARWVRVCGYTQRDDSEHPRFITDVVVYDQPGTPGEGYSPLHWSEATWPGLFTTPSDVNIGIGGDTTNIWVKYESLDPASTTPVLTDVGIQHWPYWNPHCPDGWEQAGGPKNPSGALTTGTWGACNRTGLCIKKEPVNQVSESLTATPMTNLGLNIVNGPNQISCPKDAHAGYEHDYLGMERAFRSRVSGDIHVGCGDNLSVSICGYSLRSRSSELGLNLHALADQYAPLWRFFPGEPQYPMDLDTHLTDAVQYSNPFYNPHTDEWETNPYYIDRVCDAEGWRLTYYWNNPAGGGDRLGRKFGSPGGGKAYAFVVETPKGYDIHYFVYYVYNFGDPTGFTTAWDHWGDWERATVHLEWSNEVLKPRMMTTEAHGNPWSVWWNSDEVWKTPDGHPHVFVAEESHGTYPNTKHERPAHDLPGKGSQNRTCQDGVVGAFCDFIAGDGASAILSVSTIRVDGLYDGDPDAIAFIALDSEGEEMAVQPVWLGTDYACSNPGEKAGAADGTIYRWGNTSHDGGVTTPLAKSNMPWSQ